jgi:hypothetical protein
MSDNISDPAWILLPTLPIQTSPVVWREWPDGTQESRFVSSFQADDPKYSTVMALVAVAN